MNLEQIEKLKTLLNNIADDAEADVSRYEGMPFAANTIAMITGEQNAMIYALAKTMVSIIEEFCDNNKDTD